ncbi:MAG TPA: pyridoxamine 5'-phosphate oxidase family protein [Candidatus Binataceae bacterium]|nr:pyridoxamine 5'-phosphate oxidase family protein [Candidatus Binataceae bacterium]
MAIREGDRRAILAVGAALAMLLLASGAARAGASERDLTALHKSSLIYVATVRKDGSQSRSAPVWFTISDNNTILIETAPRTWKARRIRRGSPAMVWIGSRTGPALIAKAEIVSEPAVESQIAEDYPRKYLLARMGFARPTQQKFSAGQILAIRLTPVRDLPDGFRSKPGTPAPPLDEKAEAAASH